MKSSTEIPQKTKNSEGVRESNGRGLPDQRKV
jgi:hypothetical protein